MNRDIKIYIIITVVVITIISGIYLSKPSPETTTEEVMKCIAEKSVLYTQPGCGHCTTQKEILGNYTSLFKEIDCLNERAKCAEAQITGTPTWVIDGRKFEGTQSIEELKQLAKC